MRRLILLAALAFFALHASAARRLTVSQLEQTLASEIGAHHSDADIAHHIGEIELSERLTAKTLDRFAAKLALAPRTALALQLLSDQSAFLDPPAAELPATAPPDEAAQKRILEAAQAYAAATWSRLPNFFVTRTTNRFDDTAQVLKQGEWPVRAGLHPVGSATRQVTFRDGKEVQDTAADAAAVAQPELGLRSWGEFGPALTIVLSDMASHKATFSHWELTGAGLAAVFRYEVPREASHYAVTYSFFSEQVIGRTQFGYSGRDRTAQQVANIPRTKVNQIYHETPAYDGEIAVDPATGAVLRITIEADLSSGDPLLRASAMIEYGRVTIGDRQFISPLRSLAISVEPGSAATCGGKGTTLNGVGEPCENTPVLLVNETSFTGYHRLGSTVRILTDASGAPGSDAPTAGSPSATTETASTAASSGGSSAANSDPPAAQSLPQSEPQPAVTPPATGQAEALTPLAAPTAPPPPAVPVVPEVTLSAANALPDQPASTADAPASNVTLKVTSRLVDVGVVVYDKKGHPVKDLKREDFEIYDNGRKQEIRFFSEFSGETPQQPAAPSAGQANAAATEETFTNRAPDAATPGSAAPNDDTNAVILLIDQSHIAWDDLSNARQQMLRFLKEAAQGERIGLYAMTTLGFKVLTEISTDHAALIAQLQKWMPTAQAVSQAQDEETRNRQHFDEVHNVADLNSVNGNHIDVPDAQQPVDPQLLSMGDNPARASLIILGSVARHLSAVPGHKTLVWISSDNVFADFRDQAVGIDKSSKYIDSFALHAQEAMNEAHVAVYPFDVSQLESSAITADMQHRNVELTQAASDTASLAPGGNSVGRNMTAGRTTEEMSQNLHPIQEPIQQVAEATGGRTVRRAGDLTGQLESVVAEGQATYRISFSPDTIADNQYHNITVKFSGRRGLTARYRTGYLYAKEPATLKERFQQAVWRSMDANEVALTAGVERMDSGANVKINVAASDLGMEQQAGRWMDRLDIFFIQRDDLGVHAQVEGQSLGLRLKPATYQSLLPTGVPFEHEVRLKPGTASLRVLVVDENSGRMGSVTIPADVLEKRD